jgi:hypothetical protein
MWGPCLLQQLPLLLLLLLLLARQIDSNAASQVSRGIDQAMPQQQQQQAVLLDSQVLNWP